MIFWVAVLAMTLAAVALVARPLLRPPKPSAPRGAFDRTIYRDQLKELARDVERGLLDKGQAAAARLEIERRLLATEAGDTASGAGPTASAPVDRITVAMLGTSIAAAAIALYLALGAPGQPDEPLAARRAAGMLAQSEAGDLGQRAKELAANLARNPNDADGWLLLARTQAALQRWQESAGSYKRAMALTGDSPDATAGYGEMLVLSANGIVTPAAQGAFTETLAKDPKNLAARFYMALADAQAGKPKEALAKWQKVAADSPPGAPWMADLRRHITETAKAAGLPVPALPEPKAAADAPGPDAAAIASAAKMSPEERQKMIRGMVAGLAQRLDQNPNDPAGWQRLIRAYRVLGETKKAEQAEGRLAALEPESEAGLLAKAHAMLAAEGGGHDFRTPLSADLVSVMKKVEALDPNQPDALWYLGLAAAQQHDPKGAAGYWKRLRSLLEPGSEQYKTVDAAIGALQGKQPE